MVKNVVFKTPGSWIWLSGGLTHLCSYFQTSLWVYMKYLEGDEELFVHVMLSKWTFELIAFHWGQMSLILELRLLLASKVHAIMGMYSNHAIPVWTPNKYRMTCTVYYSSCRDCVFRITST